MTDDQKKIKVAEGVIQAIQAQRNAALDAVANLQGNIGLLQAQLDAALAEIARLSATT